MSRQAQTEQTADQVVAGLFREHGLSLVRLAVLLTEAPSGHWISFAAISADGSKVYFSTFTKPGSTPGRPMTGQIDVVDLATGQSRLVYQPGATRT